MDHLPVVFLDLGDTPDQQHARGVFMLALKVGDFVKHIVNHILGLNVHFYDGSTLFIPMLYWFIIFG